MEWYMFDAITERAKFSDLLFDSLLKGQLSEEKYNEIKDTLEIFEEISHVVEVNDKQIQKFKNAREKLEQICPKQFGNELKVCLNYQYLAEIIVSLKQQAKNMEGLSPKLKTNLDKVVNSLVGTPVFDNKALENMKKFISHLEMKASKSESSNFSNVLKDFKFSFNRYENFQLQKEKEWKMEEKQKQKTEIERQKGKIDSIKEKLNVFFHKKKDLKEEKENNNRR